MPRLIEKFNWGNALFNFNQELVRQLDTAYADTARIVNTKISKVVRPGIAPPTSDQFNVNYEVGDIYVRPDTDTAFIMTSRTTATDVTWTLIT